MTKTIEGVFQKQARQHAARQEFLKGNYRKHLVAYNRGEGPDPDDVLATCQELGKSYEAFLADGERMKQRLDDADVVATLPTIDSRLREIEGENQTLQEAHSEYMRAVRLKSERLTDERNELLAKQATAQAAFVRLANGCEDPAVITRERELSAQSIALHRRIRALENRINGTLAAPGIPNLNGELLALREQISTAECNHNEAQRLPKLKQQEKETAAAITQVQQQIEGLKAEHARVSSEAAEVAALKLIP